MSSSDKAESQADSGITPPWASLRRGRTDRASLRRGPADYRGHKGVDRGYKGVDRGYTAFLELS